MARTTTVSKVIGGDVTTTRKGGGGVTVGETKIDAASLKVIRDLFAQAKELYAPGGAFTAGQEAQLARGRKRAIAGGMQGLAAAGLAGTSMAGGLARRYEEEVAAPTMARAESARLSAMTGLMTAQAGAEAQLAPRFTKQTTTPTAETTRQITTPRTTVQQTISPTISTGGGGGGAARRPAAAQLQKPPTLSAFPSLFGGTAGSGRSAGKGVTTYRSPGDPYVKAGIVPSTGTTPLGSFYSDFQKAAPKKIDTGIAGTPSLSDIYKMSTGGYY